MPLKPARLFHFFCRAFLLNKEKREYNNSKIASAIFVPKEFSFVYKKVDFINYKTPDYLAFLHKENFFEQAKLRTNCAQFPVL
jgi:hypothetical protein